MSATNFLLFKCKKYGEDNKDERNDMVPTECLGLEHCNNDDGEHDERNGLLDDFQLDEVEGSAIYDRADAVGGDHEEILDQGDAPRQQDNEDERPVFGRWDNFRQFELAVPSEGHENVGRDKK